jgi:catechol 2,3-dioxygenase-like lactoylglutathione lyase family enzyme
MAEVPKPGNLSASGCWFTGGAVSLHIGVDPAFRPATKAHPALLVDDLAALRGRMAQADCVIRDDKPVVGYVRFFTEDPFGNRIELMQKL